MVAPLKSETTYGYRCRRLCFAIATSGLMFCAVFSFGSLQLPDFRLDFQETSICFRPPSLFSSFSSNQQPPLRWRPEVMKQTANKQEVDKPELKTQKVIKLNAYQPEAETLSSSMGTIISCSGQHPVFLSSFFRPPRNTSEVLRKVVPNVVHYVLIGVARNLSFYEYLSFLSVEKFQKPDQIFVHGDIIPDGPWWNRTIQEVPNIYHVWTVPPSEVFSQKLVRVEHRTDVMRYTIIYGKIDG